MRITTWNVNSIRVRLPRLQEVLERTQTDVLCMQETKVVDEDFPVEAFEELGYNVVFSGQKTYNGVAIASKEPISAVTRDFPLPELEQARGIAVVTGGVRIVNVYVVNGKEVGHEYYDMKLRWMDDLADWLAQDAQPTDDVVLCGDFNLCPTDADTWDPKRWHGKIFCTEEERARFQRLIDWGLHDAFRLFHDDTGRYAHTWWDFRGNGFGRGHGLRIDHHLVTDSIKERASGCFIDRSGRKGAKPSDHAPVTLVLDEPDFDAGTMNV